MNWFAGMLEIYHPDDELGKPTSVFHGVSLDAAQKLVDDYPHEIREVIYHPYCINLAAA